MARAYPNVSMSFPLTHALADSIPVTVSLRTVVHKRKADFDALFEEKHFTRMKAVSYVATPSLLLDWLNKFPINHMDIVVGANLAEQYRNDLGTLLLDSRVFLDQ